MRLGLLPRNGLERKVDWLIGDRTGPLVESGGSSVGKGRENDVES
jgi:hypothetical protein